MRVASEVERVASESLHVAVEYFWIAVDGEKGGFGSCLCQMQIWNVEYRL